MIWSAPVPTWTKLATDSAGVLLGVPARFLLTHLWSIADAPSKRKPGPQFIWGGRTREQGLATELGFDTRSIQRQFAQIRDAGLARRGTALINGTVETGIWLADLELGEAERLQVHVTSVVRTRQKRRLDTTETSPSTRLVPDKIDVTDATLLSPLPRQDRRDRHDTSVAPSKEDPSKTQPGPEQDPKCDAGLHSVAGGNHEPSPADERADRIRANDLERARKTAEHRKLFPDTTPPKPGHCAPEIWAVVTKHPASSTYATDAHGKWAERLSLRVVERSLDPAELWAVLDFWKSEHDKFGTPRERDAALNSGAFPAMRDLWFYKHEEWVKWAIDVIRTPVGEPVPKRQPAKSRGQPNSAYNPALPDSEAHFAALRAQGPDVTVTPPYRPPPF
jgi:hypothetical protein